MTSRKPWREKLINPKLPKVVDIPPRMQKRFGQGKMLIPEPREVDEFIRTVRKGSLITLSEIRQALAQKHLADVTCPLVAGISLRIAAEAAEQDAAEGKTRITPWWRVVRDDLSVHPKLPGEGKRQAERLRNEGHRVIKGTGKKMARVVNED